LKANEMRSNKKPHVLLDVFGPTVEFLVLPSESAAGYCILKGTIPPGVSVPLHSHPDDESFFLLSGRLQTLDQRKDGFEWINMNVGDFHHVPQDVKHAWKNQSNEPAVTIIVTTARLGRFFQEIGRPVAADACLQPPTPADIQHFVEVAARYGHWLGSPQENAAAGIKVS
jgi:quercetin dioxygenase-like cupin family protein